MKIEWMKRIIETNESFTVMLTKKDVYDELYKICDTEHSGCNMNCPVYELAVVEKEFNPEKSNDCPYFKNGEIMFERLQGKRLVKIIVNGKTKIIDFEKANKILNLR